MAHPGWRAGGSLDRLAGGAAGPQEEGGVHRMAPDCGERALQRRLRPPGELVVPNLLRVVRLAPSATYLTTDTSGVADSVTTYDVIVAVVLKRYKTLHLFALLKTSCCTASAIL